MVLFKNSPSLMLLLSFAFIKCDVLLLTPFLNCLFLRCVQAQWYHQGAEPLGRRWQRGDVVGCLLDMDECSMMITLNGELLFDATGSELAAKDFDISDGLLSTFLPRIILKLNIYPNSLNQRLPCVPGI